MQTGIDQALDARDAVVHVADDGALLELGDPIRQRIQVAMFQVYATIGRLRGDHIDVTEAFLVVFRRSGAHAELPEEVPAGDYVVFPMLVDIAPEQKTGSREKAPADQDYGGGTKPGGGRGSGCKEKSTT